MGVDPNINIIVPLEPELVVESSKGKQPMEGTSHATQPTCASIRSIFIATGATFEVADEAEASSDFDPNDVYVALVDDTMSSSGDEFDNDEE